MANPFVHVELMSTDVNRSKEFYGKLFDWKMQDMPNPATGTLHADQRWRGHRRWNDEKSDAGRTVELDGLCVG